MTTETKQELGPMQRQWVEALRSGKYVQGTGQLCKAPSYSNEKRYCCLGVADEIFKFGNLDVDPEEQYLKKGFKELGLRSDNGKLAQSIRCETNEQMYLKRLIEMNDGLFDCQWTFNDIAKLMEEQPGNVFERPA